MKLIGCLFCGFLVAVSALSISAQPNDAPFPKLTHVPDIVIPEETRQAGLSGEVRVYVKVDSDGAVSEVRDAYGPGDVCQNVTRPDVVAVRNAAKEAAKSATFERRRGNQLEYAWVRFDIPNHSSSEPEKLERYILSSATPELRDKILSLPKPAYPPAARALRASGAVSVELLVDENGDVFSSRALSGHPLLRGAARNEGCKARFRPTILAGSPVKVIWVITYNFVP